MKIKHSLLLIIIIPFVCHSIISKNNLNLINNCNSAQQCIAIIDKIAEPAKHNYDRISNTEYMLVKKLLKFQPVVTDLLVPLLLDNNKDKAQIASRTLRDVKYIDEKHLETIKKGLDRGFGWLAPALGRINTLKACNEAVYRYLVSKSSPENQEAFAIELCGEKAIPSLIRETECSNYCSEENPYLISVAIKTLKDSERRIIAQEYIKQIQNQNLTDASIHNILMMFDSIGKEGRVVEEKIIELYKTKPKLSKSIDIALIGMSSTKTADIYSNIFKNNPDPKLLFNIAEKGMVANKVGVYIIPLLFDKNYETRIIAARTLGYIGYKPAVDALIPLINNPIDVRLNWVAVESLGMIRNKKALKALKKTAKNHWYLPVKKAAKKAIKNIKKGGQYEKPNNQSNIVFDYYLYDHIDAVQCKTFYQKKIEEPKLQKLYLSEKDEEIEKLSFSTEILSYGASNEEQQIAEAPEGDMPIIEVNVDNIKEYAEPIIQIPNVALRTKNGWLLGSNRGEWGGEIVYKGDNGITQLIAHENVEDIYKIGNRYIAIVGLAHLILNNGIILELKKDSLGIWTAIPWRILPGAPRGSWFVKSGKLLVATNGGDFVIDKNGNFDQVKCKTIEKKLF